MRFKGKMRKNIYAERFVKGKSFYAQTLFPAFFIIFFGVNLTDEFA